MRDDILRVSYLLKGKTEIYSTDYSKILDLATSEDLIYMDSPYQGTGLNGGFNYSGNFVVSIFELNYRDIPYILSYDSRTNC